MFRFLCAVSALIFPVPVLLAQEIPSADTLTQPDSIPVFLLPPQMTFLADSLREFYVVEDTSMYTYSMISEDLDYFLKTYPDILFEEKVGSSEFGLELRTVRLGRSIPNKNCVFLVGNIHAREDFSSKLVMKFLNAYLLSIDGKTDLYPDAKALLDSADIYFMPVANPDGLKIAQNDLSGIEEQFGMFRDSIKLIQGYDVWKANGKGIDLNRTFDDGNFAVKKGQGFQPVPASEGYKGKFPAEPLETRAIQQFIAEKQPLVTASFHTKGNVLFWADNKTHPFLGGIDTKIIQEVAASCGFQVSSVARYASEYGCGLENYVRARYGLLGTCVELSAGDKYRSQHPDNQFDIQVWIPAWNVPYIFIRNAVKYSDEIRANARQYRERTKNEKTID